MISRSQLILIILSIALFSLFFSLSKGSASLSFYQLLFNNDINAQTIFLKLRLPRTLTAFVSGGLLALAGALMQLLLQNPLADPYILGISGGAALFTLIMMLFGVSEYWLMGGAWLGSLFAVVLIVVFASKHHWQTQTLLLAGIALACGFSACISLVLIMSPDASLHSMLFWLTGDLNGAAFPSMGLWILIAGLIICLCLAPGLNILSRGDQEARALGLHTKKYRILLYLLSSLFTATAVTMAGCIGFVGLIIPHLTRMLIGYDHRYVLPLSILLGGSLLTVADTLARTLLMPQQIPVGILMVMLGIPIFMWLLQK